MQSLSLFRAKEWLHFLGFPLLGYFAGARDLGADLIAVLAGTALCLAYAYSLNEVMDRRLPASKLIFPAATLPLLVLCCLLLTGHRRWALVIAVVLWTLYSLPPIRLKALPVICTLINGVGFPLLYVVGLRRLEGRVLLFATVLVCLMVAAQLIHELCHQEEDRRQRIRTTVVAFGAGFARAVIVAALLLATVLAGFYRPPFAIPIGIGALVTVVALLDQKPAWVRRATRRGGAVVGLLLLGWQLLFPLS